MTWHALALFAPLVAMLLLAAATDLHRRRIPNSLTAVVVFTGLMQAWTPYATTTPWDAALGLLVGGALTAALFAIGALGGGDVKLLAGAGAWLGTSQVFAVFIAAALVGLGMVLVQATVQRRLRALCRNSALVAVNLMHMQQLGAEHVTQTGGECRSVDRPLPYAVPVLLATVLVLLLGRGLV